MDYGEEPWVWPVLHRAVIAFQTRAPCFLLDEELEVILRLRVKAQTRNDVPMGDKCFRALAAAGVSLQDTKGKWSCRDGRSGDIPKAYNLTPKVAAISAGKAIADKADDAAPPAKRARRKDLGHPTRVVLLTNMVGAGEVDEELAAETTDEAGKYGKIRGCKILEVTGAEDEEAVRIFLAYEEKAAAAKCHADMDGRYFGGRTVHARFYNEEHYLKGDLKQGLPAGARPVGQAADVGQQGKGQGLPLDDAAEKRRKDLLT